MKRHEIEQLINQIMAWDVDDYSGDRVLIDRRKLRGVVAKLQDDARKWRLYGEEQESRIEALYDRIDEMKGEIREARHEAADWQMKYWDVVDEMKLAARERNAKVLEDLVNAYYRVYGDSAAAPDDWAEYMEELKSAQEGPVNAMNIENVIYVHAVQNGYITEEPK